MIDFKNPYCCWTVCLDRLWKFWFDLVHCVVKRKVYVICGSWRFMLFLAISGENDVWSKNSKRKKEIRVFGYFAAAVRLMGLIFFRPLTNIYDRLYIGTKIRVRLIKRNDQSTPAACWKETWRWGKQDPMRTWHVYRTLKIKAEMTLKNKQKTKIKFN